MDSTADDPSADDLARAREDMVRDQLIARGVADRRVIAAMLHVPRHRFVPGDLAEAAYDDRPLPIGEGQTISQPYVVAAMTELARIRPGARVLEVGTGCGYQTAVLAELGADVYSVEIVEPLARRARLTLDALGYEVNLRVGDGWAGWAEAAPFDAIVVTAAPPEIPRPLLGQLAIGGRLVVPVGPAGGRQDLLTLTRVGEDDWVRERAFAVAFVPMTGAAQQRDDGAA